MKKRLGILVESSHISLIGFVVALSLSLLAFELEIIVDPFEQGQFETWEENVGCGFPQFGVTDDEELIPITYRELKKPLPGKVGAPSPSELAIEEELLPEALSEKAPEEFEPPVFNVADTNTNDRHKKQAVDAVDMVFISVDKLPEYPGGEKALYRFIQKNLQLPECKECESGIVYGEFVVLPTGEVSNVKIVRGRHPKQDEEALRVLRMMPKWKPGYRDGEAIEILMRLPIRYTYK